MRIADIIIGERHRKDMGDIEALARSIADVGLLHPIVVTPDNILIAGARRIEAGKFLGWKEIPSHTVDLERILDGETGENVRRKNYVPTEAVAIGRLLEPMEREAAKERQGRRADLELVEDSSTSDKDRALTRVATAVGMARPKYVKAKTIVVAAEDWPMEFGDLPEWMDEKTVNSAWKEYNHRLRAEEELAKRQQDPIPAIITKADALDFLYRIPRHSIDLLLTDPPYMTDLEDVELFAHSWVPLALSRLKRTGRAYIFTGAYPEELFAYLTEFLLSETMILEDVLVWHYPDTLGPQPKQRYKTAWQAIFYLRGAEAVPLDTPVMTEATTVHRMGTPKVKEGKSLHRWQKPIELGERFILHSTKPGDVVLDCFAGTGTFLVAASKLGRKGIGCDISEAQIQIAVSRGVVLNDSGCD